MRCAERMSPSARMARSAACCCTASWGCTWPWASAVLARQRLEAVPSTACAARVARASAPSARCAELSLESLATVSSVMVTLWPSGLCRVVVLVQQSAPGWRTWQATESGVGSAAGAAAGRSSSPEEEAEGTGIVWTSSDRLETMRFMSATSCAFVACNSSTLLCATAGGGS